ncbi:MAG: hypothetical protein ACWA5Q_01575 [bacterium]
MKRLLSTTRLTTVLFLGLLLSACVTTKFGDSWTDKNYNGPKLEHIMVVGVVKDTVEKRIFEDEFTAQLRDHGINAVPSYKYLSGNTMKAPREEVVAALKQTGADGVLVVQLKTVNKKDQYVPPNIDWVPGASYYGWYGYYGTSYDAVYSPSVITTDKYVTLQSRLFSVAAEHMVWATDTITKNPTQIRKTVRTVGDKVAGKLKGSGLIK